MVNVMWRDRLFRLPKMMWRVGKWAIMLLAILTFFYWLSFNTRVWQPTWRLDVEAHAHAEAASFEWELCKWTQSPRALFEAMQAENSQLRTHQAFTRGMASRQAEDAWSGETARASIRSLRDSPMGEDRLALDRQKMWAEHTNPNFTGFSRFGITAGIKKDVDDIPGVDLQESEHRFYLAVSIWWIRGVAMLLVALAIFGWLRRRRKRDEPEAGFEVEVAEDRTA